MRTRDVRDACSTTAATTCGSPGERGASRAAFEDLRLRFGHRVPPGRLVPLPSPATPRGHGRAAFEDCAQAAAFRCVQMLAPDVAWTPEPFRGLGAEEGVALLPSPVKSRSLLAATVHDFIPAAVSRPSTSIASPGLPHLVPEAPRGPASLRPADRRLRRRPGATRSGSWASRTAHRHDTARRRRIFHPRAAAAPECEAPSSTITAS